MWLREAGQTRPDKTGREREREAREGEGEREREGPEVLQDPCLTTIKNTDY